MRITSKGQVTIPQDIRKRFGLRPGSEVEFVAKKDSVELRARKKSRGVFESWLEGARGSAKAGVTTKKIMEASRGEG